jgi:WD40 repeat protein
MRVRDLEPLLLRLCLVCVVATPSTERACEAAQLQTDIKLGNLVGHADQVVSVDVSADGKWLLSSSWDQTSRLWEVETGRELLQFSGFRDSVLASAFIPRSDLVVTAGEDKVAHIWDIKSGNELLRLQGHGAPINAIAIGRSGKILATAAGYVPADIKPDQTVRLWNLQDGTQIATLAGHKSSVVAVKFLPDELAVVSGSLDGTVRRWNVSTGHEERRVTFPNSEITSLAVSPDGKQLAVGVDSGDGRIAIVAAASMSVISRIGTHGPSALAYSPDGTLLVTASQDGTIQTWETKTLSLVSSRSDVFGDHSPRSVAFSPDGRSLVIGATGGTILQMDTTTLAVVRTYGGRADHASGLSLTPDGHWLAMALGGERAALWDLVTGRQVRLFTPQPGNVTKVALTSDGRLLAAGAGEYMHEPLSKKRKVENLVNIWSTIDGKQVATLHGHFEVVTALKFFAHDTKLLTASYDGTARVWDVNTGAELRRYTASGVHLLDVDISPDEKYVAATTNSDSAYIWDSESTTQIGTLDGPASGSNGIGGTVMFRMASIRFSSDGSRLLTGSDDGIVREWSVASHSLISQRDTDGPVFKVCYLPDGKTIVASGYSSSIHVFRGSSATPDTRLVGHRAIVDDIVATQSKIVSAGSDATVRVWDAQSGTELAQLITFRGGGWAVIDREGHFDEPNAGNSSDLYWVAGLHTIGLSQFKSRYYRPGLLAQRFAATSVPESENRALKSVALGPDIVSDKQGTNDTQIRFQVSDQGGGVGKVTVKVNDKLVIDDLKRESDASGAQAFTLKVEMLSRWLNPNAPNAVTVQASNSDGSLLGEAKTFTLRAASGSANSAVPTLWVIAIGVSKYSGSDGSFDLQYAANDAKDFSNTLKMGGEALFGKGNVNVQLLISANPSGPNVTKENIQAAFAKLEAAKYQDVVVVYMSGHGLSFNDDYYFPTEEVNTLDISDPGVRVARTVSGSELALWLRTPARKQAIILDTCAAGALGHRLALSRSVSSDQVRALERMRERSGLYVLMGSAADKVSYEASPYERGLITQAILDGIRGAVPLKDDKFVSIAPLFDFAKEQVQELAQQLGGIQIPYVFAPLETSESFYIGSFDRTSRLAVPYHAKKPILLRPVVMDLDSLYDQVGLSPLLAAALRETANALSPDEAPYVYYDAPDIAGGTLLNGVYRITGSVIDIRFVLRHEQASKSLDINCSLENLSNCVRDAKEFVLHNVSSFAQSR